MLSKNTILKAIHNFPIGLKKGGGLRMLSKNTILKAIHNLSLVITDVVNTANAK